MREYEYPCCELSFWLFLIICLVIVALAGIASGLALGILSFSQVDLEVLIKAGRPKDKKHAGFTIYMSLCVCLEQHLLKVIFFT